MKYVVSDEKYHFKYAFDTDTGMYIRTGILDEKGKDTGADPFMGSFPHLIDVGIMGHCVHGSKGLCLKAGVECYQSGMTESQLNMSIEDFEWIAKQCKGRSNQFALGGRGDPDQHEHFEEILKICRENNIVPNYTTSGYGMTPELARISRKYCGAVAVSWYRSEYTLSAISTLLDAGVRTNIHYVVGNKTIDEAIHRLQTDDFPEGINAVVFLLHKPAGMGTEANVLKYDDRRVSDFFAEFDKSHPYKIGADSCGVPGILSFCRHQMLEALDTCEGGRYSCYISPDMQMLPCSFDQNHSYAVSLRDNTIEQAWNSGVFEEYRSILRNTCPGCETREYCMGGCPLMPEIVLCGKR